MSEQQSKELALGFRKALSRLEAHEDASSNSDLYAILDAHSPFSTARPAPSPSLGVDAQPSVAAEALKSFVNISPIVMEGFPDAHKVTFDVDSQHFDIAPDGCETKEDAEWMRDMFLRALSKVAHPGIVPGWVKCSEKMPASGSWVLAWCHHKENASIAHVERAYFTELHSTLWMGEHHDCADDQGKEDAVSSGQFVVTHWMPLPAAPKGQP